MPEPAPLKHKSDAVSQPEIAPAQEHAQATLASYTPSVTTNPALLGTRSVAQLQRSLGNRQTAQMLSVRPPALVQRMVIQRELTKSSFVEDTTWSWLCGVFHGRRGDDTVRAQVETALGVFEDSDQGAAALRTLQQSLMDARGGLDFGEKVLAPLISKLMSEIKEAIQTLGEQATVYNLDEFPRAQELADGIDMSANVATKLNALKLKFAGIDWFSYEMSGGALTEMLKGSGTRGDCRTLALLFEWVAVNALGVSQDAVKIGYYGKDYLVRGGGQVTNAGALTGNVDAASDQHWRFTSHSWVETAIGNIDLLFLTQPLDRSGWIDLSGSGIDGDKPFHQYGDIKIYRQNMAGIAHRYTTDVSLARTEPLD